MISFIQLLVIKLVEIQAFFFTGANHKTKKILKGANGEIKNAFDSDGNYIREIHNDGEIISAQLFNKFEEALDTNTKAIKNGTGGSGTTYDDTEIKTDINTITCIVTESAAQYPSFHLQRLKHNKHHY